MGSIMVGNWGIKDNVQTYRICGEKDDIYKIIHEAREMQAIFAEIPAIKYVHHGQWTVLLKIKVPVEVGCNDNSDKNANVQKNE